ncbi:MAG TPA: APC family permease [Xanthomonadales bacterium]|nr:APC family permease [Xanthomonadales bacterium]
MRELAGDRIEPRLGRFDAAMVVVSLVIGIGIFRTPALVAQHAGSSAAFFAAWALGGVVALMGALTFAEIGSRRPGAGGYYRVVADLYGPRLAFMLNWAQALMQGAGAAGVAFIGAEYLVPLLPDIAGTPPPTLGVVLATVLLLLGLNGAGIRVGAAAQNLLSLLKIALILVLALAALVLAARVAPPTPVPIAGHAGFLAAMIPVFYAYGGYHLAINLGADVRDARSNLPVAITAGMVVVVALYLVLNAGYVFALGLDRVAESSLVAAALARAVFGPAGEVTVSVAIFLSAAGFVNATILQMPRTFYAMAEDGVLPRAFLRVDPRSQVQRTGLAFFAVTILVPAFLLGSFEKLLSYVLFTDMLALIVVASTVFVLRRRGDGGAAAFRAPGHPLLPALYLACLVAVALQILASATAIALAGLAIFLTGAPLYALGRRAA